MYCKNCGNEIHDESNMFQDCKKIEETSKTHSVPTKVNSSEEKRAEVLCIISMICSFIIPLLCLRIDFEFVYNVAILFALFGLVICIFIRIKYSNNKFGRDLLLVYIFLYGLILTIWFIISSCFDYMLNHPNSCA